MKSLVRPNGPLALVFWLGAAACASAGALGAVGATTPDAPGEASFRAYLARVLPGNRRTVSKVGDQVWCQWDRVAVKERPGLEMRYEVEVTGRVFVDYDRPPVGAGAPDSRARKAPRGGSARLYPAEGDPTEVDLLFYSRDGLSWSPVDREWTGQVAELCGSGEPLGRGGEMPAGPGDPKPGEDPPAGDPPGPKGDDGERAACDQTWRDFNYTMHLYSSEHHAQPDLHVENQPLNDQEDDCICPLDASCDYTKLCRDFALHGVELGVKWRARCVPRQGPGGSSCYAEVESPENYFSSRRTKAGARDHKHRGSLLDDSCAFTCRDGRINYAEVCSVDGDVNAITDAGISGDRVGFGGGYSVFHSEGAPVASPLVGWAGVGVIVNPGEGHSAQYYRLKGFVADMACDESGRPGKTVRGPTSVSGNERAERGTDGPCP